MESPKPESAGMLKLQSKSIGGANPAGADGNHRSRSRYQSKRPGLRPGRSAMRGERVVSSRH
jgi:hypothetical protein